MENVTKIIAFEKRAKVGQPVKANPVRSSVDLKSKWQLSIAESPHVSVALVERSVKTLDANLY